MSGVPGIVTLVGAGPGDPGLLTLRALDELRRAEVVLYDALVHPRIIDHVPPSCERIAVGKRAGHCMMPQSEINALLVEHAVRGRRVVRLKGGDPYVFGRGSEEEEYVRAAGFECRVVPGVTAGIGAASYAGIPVTHRGVSSAVALVTGHGDPTSNGAGTDWPALARFPGTLVIYMGVKRLERIRDLLVAGGKDPATPAAFVQSGSWPSQRVVEATLAELPARVAAEGGEAPAIVVVGAVALRRGGEGWFGRLPLAGRRIVVTRPRDEGERVAPALEALGAEVLLAPTVEILPVEDHGPLDRAIAGLDSYDWVVFTSANGVRYFLERLLTVGRDLRALGRARIAAIGPATAEALAAFHLRPDVVPESYRSESLAASLAPHVAGARVLLARADRGRAVLQDDLTSIARVDQVAVYRNADAAALPADVARRIAEGTVDLITVTSPAIVRRLHELLPGPARALIGGPIQLASLSPLTTEAATRLGWPVAIEAPRATWESLVEAIASSPRAG